jgi:aryl-alcohol dehydrogenase-like predicted oxidoreductase
MEMRALGSGGPPISVLGYGAWVTGADTARVPDAGSLERAIGAALETGMTWVDTAEIYGRGASEEIVGRAVRGVRDDVLLVTKVGPTGAGSGMRPEEIRRAIDGSLRRLATDRIDLYLLHWHDASVPIEETWGAMTGLVADERARFVGVSNFAEDLIERCLSVGPVHAVENQLSLLHRADDGLAERLRARGIAFLAYGALAFGLLSGRVTDATPLEASDWRAGTFARYEANYFEELFAPGAIERSVALARGLDEIARKDGIPAAALALRWVVERPGVTAAVVGSTSVEHLRANARAGSVRLDATTAARIDELLARHAGEVSA